jgi:MoxR-like ATPase
MAVHEVGALAQRVKVEIAKVIVGQDRVVHDVLVAVVAGGHVRLEGVPGTA